MDVIEQDLFDVEHGFICHQVNCQGVMGSGIAKAVRQRWPNVYEAYLGRVQARRSAGRSPLGEIQAVPVGPSLLVVNMFCQDDYNRPGRPEQRHTNYGAIARAFSALERMDTLPAYVPWLFGSDRGGADWSIVQEIIDGVSEGRVTACRIPATSTGRR